MCAGVASPDNCEGTLGDTMDVGVRNRKNKSPQKGGKKDGKALEEAPADHEALKKSIEKLQRLNENINRDSVSVAFACVSVCVYV